ncbi:MAG: phage holin family protein [Nitrospirales bacterium]
MKNFYAHSSTLQVLKFLFADIKTLMSESASLLKLEMQGKVHEARQGVFQVVIGGLLAYFGVWIFTGALILGIAQFVPLWLAAGLVALVFLSGAGWFLYLGIHIFKHFEFSPKQTVQTLKEINHVFTREF